MLTLEDTLAYGLSLARRHSDVARVRPVLLAQNRHGVELSHLMQRAARLVRTSVLKLKTLQGRRNDLIANILTVMEPLFGKKEADRMEEEIKKHKYWK